MADGVTLESVAEAITRLEAKLDVATGGGKVTIALLGGLIERIRGGIADLEADMEVSAALLRRLDATTQGLVGEIRACAASRTASTRSSRGSRVASSTWRSTKAEVAREAVAALQASSSAGNRASRARRPTASILKVLQKRQDVPRELSDASSAI